MTGEGESDSGERSESVRSAGGWVCRRSSSEFCGLRWKKLDEEESSDSRVAFDARDCATWRWSLRTEISAFASAIDRVR